MPAPPAKMQHFPGECERGVAPGEFENQKSGNSAEHKQERFAGSAHRDGGIAGDGQGCLCDRAAEKSAESEKQAVHAAGCCAGSFSLVFYLADHSQKNQAETGNSEQGMFFSEKDHSEKKRSDQRGLRQRPCDTGIAAFHCRLQKKHSENIEISNEQQADDPGNRDG